MNITSSGIFSNTAASGSGRGGGILNGSGTMTIVNSTFYLNTANRDGGGIYSNGPPTRLYDTTSSWRAM